MDELCFVLNGEVEVGIVGTNAESQISKLAVEDVAFVPMNWLHYISNAGHKPARVLLFHDATSSLAISLSQTLKAFPPEVLAAATAWIRSYWKHWRAVNRCDIRVCRPESISGYFACWVNVARPPQSSLTATTARGHPALCAGRGAGGEVSLHKRHESSSSHSSHSVITHRRRLYREYRQGSRQMFDKSGLGHRDGLEEERIEGDGDERTGEDEVVAILRQEVEARARAWPG